MIKNTFLLIKIKIDNLNMPIKNVKVIKIVGRSNPTHQQMRFFNKKIYGFKSGEKQQKRNEKIFIVNTHYHTNNFKNKDINLSIYR